MGRPIRKFQAARLLVQTWSAAHANTTIISANLALTIHSTCAMSCPARCPDQASTRNAASLASLPLLSLPLVTRVHARRAHSCAAIGNALSHRRSLPLRSAAFYLANIYERRPTIDPGSVNCASSGAMLITKRSICFIDAATGPATIDINDVTSRSRFQRPSLAIRFAGCFNDESSSGGAAIKASRSLINRREVDGRQ